MRTLITVFSLALVAGCSSGSKAPSNPPYVEPDYDKIKEELKIQCDSLSAEEKAETPVCCHIEAAEGETCPPVLPYPITPFQ